MGLVTSGQGGGTPRKGTVRASAPGKTMGAQTGPNLGRNPAMNLGKKIIAAKTQIRGGSPVKHSGAEGMKQNSQQALISKVAKLPQYVAGAKGTTFGKRGG